MNKPLRLVGVLASLALLHACSQANSHASDSYAAPVEEERPKTAAELRAELLAQEQSDPEQYLQAGGLSRRNLIGQLVLEGDIANTATLATYKDPVLSVTWYSKTHTEVGTKEYPIYELVPARARPTTSSRPTPPATLLPWRWVSRALRPWSRQKAL